MIEPAVSEFAFSTRTRAHSNYEKSRFRAKYSAALPNNLHNIYTGILTSIYYK
jgi:hypothetical protein